MNRRVTTLGCFLLTLALTGGCYEKVIRVKTGDRTTEVADPDFNEQPSALDEVMWGPVPKGQDPATYYRKKKQLLAQ
ncbi:MAG: hypothetical protein EXS01_05250 [Phycisphaerales bacterium]|nr:hypothetical protein [Phycisphaerales bacterium]